MKISKVLLRWYKSFNVNYAGYADRKAGVTRRPWNLLGRNTEDESDFPFIEIPLEEDITTIVGANESGKSHLLSAISKVITGHGIPESNGESTAYSRTDLCHYTSPRSKNAEDWPNVGLQFKDVSQTELEAIGNAIEQPSFGKTKPDASYLLTVVIAPNNRGTEAYLYPHDAENPVELDKAKLDKLRGCLPKVEFIKSGLAFSDQVPIGTLLNALGRKSNGALFDYKAAQDVSSAIISIAIPKADSQLPKEITAQLHGLQDKLKKANLEGEGKSELEALLFRDVLGITPETLEFVANLDIEARTHADGLTTKWNREIEEILNLSHYWQQDDSFALLIAYRQGIIYFEITDKTGATYTFKERSSGLRYFLSYYIQAKALEKTSRDRDTIVLMDEPDSFLSILGQRNLLEVFESLVRPESSTQKCQLVYTTHSPFLINLNYPRRLRLVRKGEAEEGTQLVSQAMLRRYEPVRSALGVDCAQTLFMGATNVVVEGPTDQYLICELVRLFVTPSDVNDYLDLNSIAMVSAESAPSIEKVLAASQWGDESIPATVVLLDSDEAGHEAKKRITGKARNCKQMIADGFVLQIGTVLESEVNGQKIVTVEDLVPTDIYAEAVLRYVRKWHPDTLSEKLTALKTDMDRPEFAANGLAAGTRATLNTHVHDSERDYDKMGILHEVVDLITHEHPSSRERFSEINCRLKKLCEALRRAVSASQQAARRVTGKQTIRRIIDEFFITHKQSSSVFEVQLLIDRIKKDTDMLGIDGEGLDSALKRLGNEVDKLRASGQKHLADEAWICWRRVIESIRKNPLDVQLVIRDGLPEVGSQDNGAPERASGTEAITAEERNAEVSSEKPETVEEAIK